MSRALPFTKASVMRAITAAQCSGLRVTGIRPDGTVLTDSGDKPAPDVHDAPSIRQTSPILSKWEDQEA